MHNLWSIIQRARLVLSPRLCSYCSGACAQGQVLCDRCISLIKPVVSADMVLTARRTMTVFAASAYQDPLKSLILSKVSGNHVAAVQLAQLVWLYTPLSRIQFDCLVPVPLHWTRYAWRGYNQALVMAQQLSQLSGKPCYDIVTRDRKTVKQNTLSARGRVDNVTQLFSLSIDHCATIRGQRVMIVDDLMTTGATVTAVARVLMRARPLSLHGVVGCRVA